MATFLTSDWLSELTDTINANEAFKAAIANVDLTLQFEVPDAPEAAESTYYISIGDGVASAAPGPHDGADATITNNYETAVAISKGELNTQMAFMTGKLKVAGNMAKLMMNQAMLGAFANAAADVDVDY